MESLNPDPVGADVTIVDGIPHQLQYMYNPRQIHQRRTDCFDTDEEIETALQDLFKHNVDIVTLGQYMRPTKNHLPVDRWVTPEQFEQFREYGLSLGFMEVASGPLVRSSYRADKVFAKNNLGLSNKDAISVVQL